MKKFLVPLLILCLLLISACRKAEDLNIPVLHSRVTDLTGTLSSSEQQSLEQILAANEDSTTTQIAVLLIPSLNGEDLFEYTQAVAEKNKIGTKEHNNGVLLLVAMSEHKVRIHVGYGLEGALPDATTKSIIENEILPRFKDGKYYSGILSGTRAIEEAVKGEYKAGEHKAVDKPQRRSIRNYGWPIIVGIIILFSIISRMARATGAMVHGRGYRRYSSGFGGFWWGGFGGGGFGGGGFGGGGGWSGGGGSFGGGGASGSW